MEAPEVVRDTLRRRRLELVERETATLAKARRLLTHLEGTAANAREAPRLLEQARWSVKLAEEVCVLGLQDARRVGASLPELAAATGMPETEILVALGEGTESTGGPAGRA